VMWTWQHSLLILFHMQHVVHCSSPIIPGYLDFDNLPDTNFSCEGKVIGGYYADIETGCQMFHVCTIGQKGEITDIKFLCLNGTVFDQETRVCERVDEVDCSKTEGFYDLNLELYGNNAALSYPEEETGGNSETQENAETNDGTSSKHKTSTSKPPTSTTTTKPLTPHPASTTTLKTPVHPFVPTTTASPYKPNQHITHFHSTTAPSIAAFLAINNAFSSANSNQDDSSQYDEDEEEEEEDSSITDHPGIGDTNHHYPATTITSQIRPIGPEQHSVNRLISRRSLQLHQHNLHISTVKITIHLKETLKPNVHSKHQLNTHLILNQQRENENKQHHGFKPNNRNQFLYSTTTRPPPIYFTTKSPTGYSTTIHSQSIEPFSLHGIGPQPPIQTTQQAPSNSPFPLQTNAHQVPANPLVQQIRSNIANNGGFLTQTIQLSQNPLNFQFNSNNNNRQGNQLFTTPSVAVIATTSILETILKQIIPLSLFKYSLIQLLHLNDEYQEADVSSDPFFRDVPKLTKPSTQLKSPAPTIHGIISKPRILRRYKRRAQVGLPTEVFGTGEGRYRNRQRDQSVRHGEDTNHQGSSRIRSRVDSQSRRAPVTESVTHRSRSRTFDTTTSEYTTLIPEIPQQIPHLTSLDVSSPSSATKQAESAILESPVQSGVHHDQRRKVLRVIRPHKHGSPEIDVQNSPRLRQPMIHDPELHQNLQATSSTRVVESYDTQLAADNLESHHIPTTTRGNVENRRHHLESARSRSNLEHESFTEPVIVSRQRGRQRVRPEVETNVATVRTSSRRVDHSDSEISDRQSSRSHSRAPTSSRGRGRNLSASHRSHEVVDRANVPTETNTDLVNSTTFLPPPPLPNTNFSCAGKIPGGYYADLEADCQLFHICSMGRHGRLQDNKFLCGPGTRFNQKSRTCQVRDLVDCSASASLYYLNNHFNVHPEENVNKKFDAKKIRTKRKAPKAGTNSGQQYSIDDLPETSFTCADKPQDGLYADVETQCHVFHLCRTISGILTLESSFVCPPGTVFNQPEGNCDTTKEVDCALYSAPEHNFKKTSPSAGHKNQGSKVRTKRHDNLKGSQTTVRSFKLKKNTNFKKLAAQLNKKHRIRRDESDKKEAINLYDYVDDNYEAHMSKPINRPEISELKKDSIADVEYEDYDYDLTTVSTLKQDTDTENIKHTDPILEESISNAKEIPTDAVKQSNSPHTTELTTELQPIKFTTDADKENITSDYEYEYEYEDETTVATVSNSRSKSEFVEEAETKRNVGDATTRMNTVETSLPYNSATTETTTVENNIQLTTSSTTLLDKVSTALVDKTSTTLADKSSTTLLNKDSTVLLDEASPGLLDETLTPLLNKETTTLVDKASTTLLDKESIALTDKVIHPLDVKEYQDLDENTKRSKNQVTESTTHLKVDSSTPSEEYEYEYYYDDEEFVDESNSSDKSNIKNGDHTTSKPVDISTKSIRSTTISAPISDNEEEIYSHGKDKDKELDERDDVPYSSEKSSTTLKNTHYPFKSTSQYTTLSITTENIKLPEKPVTESRSSSKLLTHSTRAPTTQIDDNIEHPETSVTEKQELSVTNPSIVHSNDRIDSKDITPNYIDQEQQIIDKELFPELFETQTNPSFLQELDKNSAVTRKQNFPQPSDDITLSSLSTHLNKKLPPISSFEVTTSLPVSEQPVTSDELRTAQHFYRSNDLPHSKTTQESTVATELKDYDLTFKVTAYSKHSMFSPTLKEDITTEPATVLTSTSAPTTTIPTTIPSLFRPSKQLIQSRNQVNNRRPTIKRNRNQHIPARTENNNSETLDADRPVRVNNRRRFTTTTIAPTLVVENPTISDQETSSHNTVPNIYPSPFSKALETTTPSYVSSDSYNSKSEFPSTSSKNPAVTDINSYNPDIDSIHLTTESADATKLLTVLPSENSVSPPVEDKMTLKDATSLPQDTSNDTAVEYATGKEYRLKENSDGATRPSVAYDSPRVSQSTGFVCTGKELHRYHLDPDDCRMFHYCSPGFHTRQVLDFRFTCEEGTAFKADTQKCE
ncbi:hypothetical protein L9F63_016756, partial [Diploptera punctata]